MRTPSRTYYSGGQVRSEAYHVSGHLHRTDGPALTLFNKNGHIHSEEFWLGGDKVTAYDVLGDTSEAFAWAMTNE